MTTPHKYAKFIHAFADGKTLQLNEKRGWKDWTYSSCPHFFGDTHWRIKPDEPKKVKYLAYESINGVLFWINENKITDIRATNMRVPELDREITLTQEE